MWCQLTSTMKKHILKPECYPRFYTDKCPDTGYFARSSYCTEVTPNNYRWIAFRGTPFHALMMEIKEYEKYPHLGYKKVNEKNIKILRHIQQVNSRVQHLKDNDDHAISVSSVNESVTRTNTDSMVDDNFVLYQNNMYYNNSDNYY